MTAIGGYPELELQRGEHYHNGALKLNTARNCLEYIFRVKKYTNVYIPYYTCEAILEPFQKLDIDYTFYDIDFSFEVPMLPRLKDNEAFLYTNYFGLKQDYVIKLASVYGSRLIIDNSQAFFDLPLKGVDTFYSARKFFGVPDGAYLYINSSSNIKFDEIVKQQDTSYERMTALLKRLDLSAQAGYQDFHFVEKKLSEQPIKKMSNLTEAILKSINYDFVRRRRRDNYTILAKYLTSKNWLSLALNNAAVPLTYPFFDSSIELREELKEKMIFCPTYWSNVFLWTVVDSVEHRFADYLIPLPIDQRYDKDDMERIIKVINN